MDVQVTGWAVAIVDKGFSGPCRVFQVVWVGYRDIREASWKGKWEGATELLVFYPAAVDGNI